jgi:hypothetical protein
MVKNDVTAEIAKMKNEISIHMKERIEPILMKFYNNDDMYKRGKIENLPRTIWFYYVLNDEVKSFSFRFAFINDALCVITTFHCAKNGFTFEKEKSLEKVLDLLTKQVRKNILSKLYEN